MKKHAKGLAVWIAAILLLLIASIAAGTRERSETVQEAMRDAVLHDINQVSLFGIKDVNPGLISAFLVTAVLFAAALLIRLFVIPRFQYQPGKLQLLLEEAVGLFDNMARGSSPWRCRFMGAYIFAAGSFIFVSTLFELLGLQAVTVHGHSVTLPAPLSDVNAAIAMGTLSYLVILSGGIAVRRTAQRPAGDGAGLLLREPQLCSARDRGGAVHPAPRADPGLRAHHAGLTVLRGSVRTGPQAEKILRNLWVYPCFPSRRRGKHLKIHGSEQREPVKS